MRPQNPILVVDDSKNILDMISALLQDAGLTNIITCHDSREVMSIISANQISVLILDLLMPHISGERLLEKISQKYPEIPVIILTGLKDLQPAIRCMTAGAFDYVIKKLDIDRLISSVNNALNLRQRILSQTLQHPEAFAEIITKDKMMLSLFQYVESIAPTSQPVLITGETGTGKYLFAQALHTASRRKGDMVTLNVAGFDDNMFSDTLFGHVRGAFSGADTVRTGMVERAPGGTLFLDEIGDLSPASQVKLLRFIQNGEYLPLGSDRFKKSDARIITATNKDICKLPEKNMFRDDLIHRLKTHNFNIPPLRERRGDIPILVNHFAEKASEELGKKILKIPAMLVSLLESYSFPGNVRELEGVVLDAVSRELAGTLPTDLIRPAVPTEKSSPDLLGTLKELPSIKDMADWLVDEAMKRALGNQSVAARILGITQPALSTRLKKRRQF